MKGMNCELNFMFVFCECFSYVNCKEIYIDKEYVNKLIKYPKYIITYIIITIILLFYKYCFGQNVLQILLYILQYIGKIN